MKIIALSDMHGDLPVISQNCDVVCICGDVVPLSIQRNIPASVEWMRKDFRGWCDSIDCKNIVIVAGNHDFVFETLSEDWYNIKNKEQKPSIPCWKDFQCDIDHYRDLSLHQYVEKVLNFSDRMVYLQDSIIEIDGKTFYGTPHIPELSGWAFYEPDEKLEDLFSMIPDKVDVLLTHSPGKFVNYTGVSLEKYTQPECGSVVLTRCVQKKEIGLWLCGHVHSGNHHVEKYGNTLTANVSIKSEGYKVVYDPLVIEI